MTSVVYEHTSGRQTPLDSVLIVDDHSLIAQGLSLALRAEGLDVHAAAEPDVDLVVALARVHRPVLALVDLQFDGVLRGDALVAPLSEWTSVIVLTGLTDGAVLGQCLEAGAVAVVSKSEPFDHLLERIKAAIRNEPAQSARDREDLLAAASQRRAEEARRFSQFASLSQREQEVLELLAEGFAAEQIAERVFVALSTVRTHIQAILRKLDVNSQLAAVARVREAGWSFDLVAR
jgi:DNA-binding NarL/FixJ family response regulator